MKIPDPLDPDSLLDEAFAKEASAVRLRVDSRRYGKKVTVLDGFDAKIDLDALATELKRAIGTGGTAKDRTVELQGDHVRVVRELLEQRGFHVA